MRQIAQIQDQQTAETIADYLYLQGIENTLHEEETGLSLWVHDDEDLEKAQNIIKEFLNNPKSLHFLSATQAARDQRLRQRKAEKESRFKQVNARTTFGGASASLKNIPPVTLALIAISVVVSLLSGLGKSYDLIHYLFISEYGVENHSFAWAHLSNLVEIKEGELWRLVTPIFVHFGLLHIIFNMLWLKDLGTVIEKRFGWTVFLAQVLLIGAASNVGQYLVSGPLFGGMSGVVYGLLGFLWIRGKFDRSLGLRLNSSVVTMMLIWLGIGYVGALWPTGTIISHMANMAHTVGLVTGMAWGYLSSLKRS
ncbi:MAG: rhomboid family intramembrane serine protease [Deltaproteobacteria bacterium]|nr:rhomboid family intramembrane serine protease [Deltaproteobacteria bacterium]